MLEEMTLEMAMQTKVDPTPNELIESALATQEGKIASNGALTVYTGKRTGRSPKDRFIVKEDSTAANIDWGDINQPMQANTFHALWMKAHSYIVNQPHYVSHLQVGADQHYCLPVKVITEFAWHNLFAQNLFIRELNTARSHYHPWTILNVPGFIPRADMDGTNSDGVVAINFAERKVLLCGMRYAGEMKKAMFSVLNYLLPEHKVLPMHCAANADTAGNVALFFGLSGTGKTTLSADPERYLIGDDEHGWSEQGVFNFEGGCYAKCIDLSAEREPVIYQALRKGAIMENVALNSDNTPDFANTHYTQNTRAAYPREFIAKRIEENAAGHPQHVLFLTCDLYGVLPPVALLTPQQAAYYFLSGYTALVGSTEVGQAPGVKPTFSTCFGAPFFPRPAQVYAELLMQRMQQTGAQVYLVNTGWTGGSYGQGGERFSIPTTRAIVSAILKNQIDFSAHDTIPGFNLIVPKTIDGLDSRLLTPQKTWANQAQYEQTAQELIQQFRVNFEKFTVDQAILNAGPTA
jgi:phosphoenolpyruvate carboxykinase (ATP)